MLGRTHCLSGLAAGAAVGSLALNLPAAPLALFTGVVDATRPITPASPAATVMRALLDRARLCSREAGLTSNRRRRNDGRTEQ